MKPEDYPCYGEKVYAIADGKVVRVYNEMDRNTIGISKEEEDKLISIHGYWPIIAGNVVAIQHDNGEYSAVDYLQFHSIDLKVGDTVKQGQVIGLVGNTGLSGIFCASPPDGSMPSSLKIDKFIIAKDGTMVLNYH